MRYANIMLLLTFKILWLYVPPKKTFVRSEEAHEKNSVLETPVKITDWCTWKVCTSFSVLVCLEELWPSNAMSLCCWQHLLYLSSRVCVSRSNGLSECCSPTGQVMSWTDPCLEVLREP